MAVSNTIANWDFNRFHVQQDIETGEFINAFSVLISAGPPKLRFAGDSSRSAGSSTRAETSAIAYPIGVIENFNIAQNRQLQRLFEIGSKRSYFISGRNIGSVQFARTLFHGPNLLRSLYAFYPKSKINSTVAELLATTGGRAADSSPVVRDQPGFGDFFGNLDSDLFDQPFGILAILRDSRNQPYAGLYLEDCMLRAYQFSINSSSTLVAEGGSAEFDKAVPVNVGAIARANNAATRFEEALAA
jgi:hypothetical protein